MFCYLQRKGVVLNVNSSTFFNSFDFLTLFDIFRFRWSKEEKEEREKQNKKEVNEKKNKTRRKKNSPKYFGTEEEEEKKQEINEKKREGEKKVDKEFLFFALSYLDIWWILSTTPNK